MPTSFVNAVKTEFFTGSPASEVIKELKMLTDDDKVDLYHGLKRSISDIEPPKGSAGQSLDVSSNPRNY